MKENEKNKDLLHDCQFYQTIFDRSLDAMIIVDANDRTIRTANRTTKEILGYNPEDLESKPFANLFPRQMEQNTEQTWEQVKSYGTTLVESFRLADGTIRSMDMTATMIPYAKDSVILVTLRDVSDRVEAEKERERLIAELQDAIAKIKTLTGLIPICMHCKKIRNDNGYWEQVENFVRDHSTAEFSHGICPDCMTDLYPDFFGDETTAQDETPDQQ